MSLFERDPYDKSKFMDINSQIWIKAEKFENGDLTIDVLMAFSEKEYIKAAKAILDPRADNSAILSMFEEKHAKIESVSYEYNYKRYSIRR